MIERYIEQYEAITTMLCLLDRNDLIIPSNQNSMLKEIVKTLQPFEAATREMSGEKYTSASKIIPVSKALQRLTSSQMDQNGYLLAQNLISDMRIWFLNIEEHELLALATLLDPRFKKLAFANKEAADKAARYIMGEISSLEPSSLSTDTDVSLTSGPSSESPLWQFFDQQVLEVSSQRTPSNTIYTEMQQYLRSPVQLRDIDPLQWWKNNSLAYLTLALAACKYLGIIATSVPSERLFSKAGELLSVKRSRIKAKHVDMLLFLNKNSD
uniref:HAT C-terminal dimerisation domain-containing protein n=2 Tax=Amphimedon queenslandica TaxID=400682 RepID=A0A1X7T797_AMPQE